MTGGGQQQALVGQRVLEHLGGAGERRRDGAGYPERVLDLGDAVDRLAERHAGARSNEIVTAGRRPSWLIESGPGTRVMPATAESGTSLPLVARRRISSRRSAVQFRRGSNSVMTW